jgi:hypothetical protein
MIGPVIRFSAWTEDNAVIIRFKTLQCYENVLISLIEGVETYLAPDSLVIIEGWRDRSWLYVIVSVDGYEKEYVEMLLRDRAWLRGIKLIKVVEAEVEVP